MSKKTYIVPGVHDPIPPQGRVSVQLLDPDRPWRVKKEVRAENVVMNWWLSGIDSGFRGGTNDEAIDYQSHFAPNAAMTEAGFTTFNKASVHGGRTGHWPGRYGNYNNRFWASDQNLTPDADKPWIPSNDTDGTLTAWSPTDVIATLDAEHLARGTPVAAESWSKWDQARTVMEWGTTQGNGTWRSVGFGEIQLRSSGNTHCPSMYTRYDKYPTLRNPDRTPDHVTRHDVLINAWTHPYSMSFKSPTELWNFDTSGNLSLFNVQDWTTTYGVQSFGVGSGQAGVVALGSDVWVTRNSSVYRVDPDISASVTILNTYDITASIGGDTLYDITTDGTDLYVLGTDNVHKVNTSGVWQSSWAHSLTLIAGLTAPNLEYDPGMGHLWLSPGDNPSSTSGSHTEPWGSWDSYGDSSWETDTYRIKSFNLTGTAQNYTIKPGYSYGSDPFYPKNGITGLDAQGWVWWYHVDYYGGRYIRPIGPNCISHANIGSDIVKTSSEALKVVYDFDFT